MSLTVIAVTGGRKYSDRETVFRTLDDINARYHPMMLIVGDATGADALAVTWAVLRDVPYRIFYAKWNTYGRAAGPIRNRDMLKFADRLVAFPGGAGTQDCTKAAESMLIPVEVAK
jgi:YspA, cpYpsA-related SLOG family